ncbi:MAG: hypothetical protein RIT28_297 [Pseudomonadota bacterium]
MALIQPAPSTPADVEANRPLDIPPEAVAEMSEAEWYAKVYRGDDVPQLTLRSILMGSVLGFFLAFTNLYIGLKTGWHLGVAITACILSYSIWTFLVGVGVAKTPMSILENNCMQSTASAAGYSTGGTMVSAIAALLILSATPENPQGVHLPIGVLVGWTVFLAILGVVLAIPMKRNLINQERLKFPSGLASAVTLQSLYASGSEASKKAKALLISAVFGAIWPPLTELNVKNGEPLLTSSLKLFDWLPIGGFTKGADGARVPAKASDWTIAWDVNPVMVAAGALVGLRVAAWMAIGGLVLAFVAGPWGQEQAWTNLNGKEIYAVSAPGKAWRELGLWLGAPILVASGVLSFLFQWRSILRAFQSFGGAGKAAVDEDPRVAATEVPTSWFGVGMLVSGAGVVTIAALFFEVPVHLGILAVFMTFALALVAARITGESDITPTGAMGKIMQLTYGVLLPQSATANLMTAGITAGAASSTADLLTDLKSGYVLGANPRRQFLAQVFGIIPGTIATVIGFRVLVPDATALTGTGELPAAFPAPSAQAWKAVAEVFREGIGNMHPAHQNAIAVGLIFGAALVLAERFLPKLKPYLPSASGLGLGFILPFNYPLAMLAGALLTFGWEKLSEKTAKDYVVPVSSGIIAGVSIVGVLVQAINNFVLGGGGGH